MNEIRATQQHAFLAASTARSTSLEEPAATEVMNFPVTFEGHEMADITFDEIYVPGFMTLEGAI